MIGGAEPQGVQIGDGSGAHGEDVTHDAADAGRGSLVGLDVARVVVAFHFENGTVAVAEVDDAGVLARALDDLGSCGGQLFEPVTRRLIGAVLRPHDREDAEFGDGRLAAHDLEQALVFIRFEAVLGDEFGCDHFNRP